MITAVLIGVCALGVMPWAYLGGAACLDVIIWLIFDVLEALNG